MYARQKLFVTSILAILCLIGPSVSAQEEALDERCALPAGSDYSVRTLLDALRRTTALQPVYSESYLDTERRIHLADTPLTVRALLDSITQATRTVYQLRGNQIIFRKKDKRYIISGYTRDAFNGENLAGTNVWSATSSLGTSSNHRGFYRLMLPADTVQLRGSFTGRPTEEVKFLLNRDTTINWNFSDDILAEVVVSSGAAGAPYSPAFDLSVPTAQLLAAPVLLGEVDLLKGLQRLPGVQSGVDGSADLYVRGSGPDHNLVLLDGVPLYNASHLFGFFSVFNTDAINHINFYKGGFPARYGGRLASVVDVQLKEGNHDHFQGTGSVGLLSSRLTLEGPLFSSNTSFLVSGRYSHLGPVTQVAKWAGSFDGLIYSFHDFNAKLSHSFSPRDQLYLSTYVGNDRYSTDYKFSRGRNGVSRWWTNQERFRWGSTAAALRWHHVYSSGLSGDLALSYGRYRSQRQENEVLNKRDEPLPETVFDRQQQSDIYDGALKADWDYRTSPYHRWRFGGSVTHHSFRPSRVEVQYTVDEERLVDTTYGDPKQHGIEGAVYVENEIQLLPSLTANAGLRLSGFWVENASYWRAQPRLQLNYQPTGKSTMWASYSRMAQFMHLLSNPSIVLPSDQWVPTASRLAPEISQQWSLGWHQTLGSAYTLQAETYYKDLQQVVEYKAGSHSLYSSMIRWDEWATNGRGRSYGVELLAQRTEGRLTGWLGYALSRSERQFDEINEGNWFPFKYDRRHEIDVGGVFHWKENVDVSWGWGFASGFALTLPTVTFSEVVSDEEYVGYNDRQRTVYGSRNGQRSRATHRLDLSISFRKEKRWGERTWEFGLYNAYSRRNPFNITFYNRGWNDIETFQFMERSLLPILPFVNYRFEF